MKKSHRSRKQVRVFRTKEERQRLIDEYSRSGEKRADFCRNRNLSIKTFNNWLRKHSETDWPFAEVALPRQGIDRNLRIVIKFPNGITAKIVTGEDITGTARLIREVIGC